MPNVNPGLTAPYQDPSSPEYNKPSTPSIGLPTIQKITNAIVILIMILVITIVAGFDDHLGHILAVFMGGVLLIWFVGPGTGELQDWLGRANLSGQQNVTVV